VLYETNGWISDLRVSPGGNLVAFLDHPFANDDMGDVAVIDSDRKKTTLASGWMSEQGLAWSPAGDEVWFSAAAEDSPYAIYAARLDGTRRTVTRGPIKLILHDISRDGRVLLSHDSARAAVIAKVAGTTAERDVSSLDLTLLAAISRDGKSVLLSEQSSSGGKGYDIFLRGSDGASPVHLGTGLAADLSADGKRTVARSGNPDRVMLLSNGVGEPRPLSHRGLEYRDVRFFPDGERVLVLGSQDKGRPRFFEQSITGGTVRALTAEADRLSDGFVSPDGKLIGFIEDKAIRVQPVAGGEARTLGEAAEGDELDGFIDDGRALLVHRRGERPAKVFRIDVATGKRSLWKQIVPADPAGFVEVTRLRATPDGRSYAYTYFRVLSTLYLVDGLR
jgi:Tol biopolymer transport system component